jgi:hypothetical protein
MTLAGASAVFIDLEVGAGCAANGRHRHHDLVHCPSNPPGWSAGKWGEWYPDILGADGKLTTSVPKPCWQAGWLAQHDRLMTMLAGMRNRVPLVVSGDLHAIAIGRMLRCGMQNFEANPITTVLSGPVGTNPTGWPSARRGISATPPSHIDLREDVAPIEQHGFTMADLPDRIDVRLFKWDVKTDTPDAIDSLEPFHTARLPPRRHARESCEHAKDCPGSCRSLPLSPLRRRAFLRAAHRHCASIHVRDGTFASAHASTIVETSDGLVAAWFGGTREGAADVGIWLSRRVGDRWTPPVEVATGTQADGRRFPCWNPSWSSAGQGLMLFCKVGPSPQTWWGMVGRLGPRAHWPDVRRSRRDTGPIKNKPVPRRRNAGGLQQHRVTRSTKHVACTRAEHRCRRHVTASFPPRLPTEPGSTPSGQHPHSSGRQAQAVGHARSGRIFDMVE